MSKVVLTILCALTLTACASGTSRVVTVYPDAELLRPCAPKLPPAESGRRSDMLRNRIESKRTYQTCAQRHNALIKLPIVLQAQ